MLHPHPAGLSREAVVRRKSSDGCIEPLTDIVCEKHDVRFVPGPDLVHRSSARTQDGRCARWRWLTGIVFPRSSWREIISDIVPNSLLDLVSVKPTCQPE